MHIQLVTATLMTLMAGSVLSQEQTRLSDEADRINYTIGHQIGTDFKKQQVQLDQQALLQGIQDGHDHKQPSLDARQMNQRLVDLKRNITRDMEAEAIQRMQKQQEQVKNKRREGQQFLQANQQKEGVITTPSGLQYKVITPGSGPMPRSSDQVRIDYRARRLNDQAFDGSFKQGGPSIHSVSGVIPGFSEALKMMQPGAKWELYLPWDLAYGRKGPLGHETIIIEVELLSIVKADEAQQASGLKDSE